MESCSIVLESHPIFSVFDEAVTFAVKKEDAEANFLQVRIGLDVLGSFIVSFLTLYLEWVFNRINCHYNILKNGCISHTCRVGLGSQMKNNEKELWITSMRKKKFRRRRIR